MINFITKIIFIFIISVTLTTSYVLLKAVYSTGMAFKLGTKVTAAKKEGSVIKVNVENVKDPSKKEEVTIEFCLFLYI